MEQKQIVTGCLGLFTFVGACVSLGVAAVGVGEIIAGGPDLAVKIGALSFLIMMFGFFSFATFQIFSKKKVSLDLQVIERRTLSFAQHKEGYVSVAELALYAEISVDEARQVLDELVLKNVSSAEVSESGKLVYIFDAFIGVDKTKKDTLEIAIENARAATENLKKKRAAEEEAEAVEQQVDVHVDY